MPSKDLTDCEAIYCTPEVNQNDVPLGIVVIEDDQNPPYAICLFDTERDVYTLLRREVDAQIAIDAINDIINQIT